MTWGTYRCVRYRREHVGFVFQFYPSLKMRENVALVTDNVRSAPN